MLSSTGWTYVFDCSQILAILLLRGDCLMNDAEQSAGVLNTTNDRPLAFNHRFRKRDQDGRFNRLFPSAALLLIAL